MHACVMYYLAVIILITGVFAENVIHYDTLTGRSLSEEEYRKYIKLNITLFCSGAYEPCDASEGRRMDETCNNLRYPYRGPPRTPSSRDLPPYFGKGNTPKKTKSGKEPDPVRKQRTRTLIEGDIPDTTFTALTAHYMLFIVNGLASIHDTINYVRWIPYCCEPRGKKNPECNPMKVPEDDTVHQFSGIKCMNMTKPLTYQSLGCTKDKSLPPERINSASNFLDLSIIYGFDNKLRTMEDGLLQYEVENGRIWPVSTDARLYCLQNQPPRETRCHKVAHINGLMGTNFFSIIFWRLHNFIARKLKEVNPCWSDQDLFSTARDINIAMSTQIYYYELMPEFLGGENILREHVITWDGGFRDEYDKNEEPRVSMDYIYALRWGHTIQPGMAKLHNCNTGKFETQIPSTNLTLRTGYYAIDNNMDRITCGAHRQPMGKIDHVVDPFIGETGLGYLQRAFDITAADLIKGGLLGIAPYVHYRRMCTGQKYSSFEDLEFYGDINPEYIRILKEVYEDIEDIPLMVGIWLENLIDGGFAPRTLYCLKVKQLKRFVKYDRHWYERPNRPNAFNREQLAEIRKVSMSWILCAVGGSVKTIQPRAFLLPGKGNKMTRCANIPQINFSAWAESE